MLVSLLYSSKDAGCHATIGIDRMKIVFAGDSSILVEFGNSITAEIQDSVLGLFHALREIDDPRIRNLHPGYVSLLVDFDPLRLNHQEVTALIESLASNRATAASEDFATITIPVCYDAEFGLDLAEVAAHTGLAPDEVIRIHSSATYRVYFLGFTAGFVYLGGMPEALNTPRLSTPRRAVAPGSVGIAGGQTGIYPTETPGGWRLIGRTPVRMFDPEALPPTRVQAGDIVRFDPIDRAEFDRRRLEQA
jgi:KipI family sensor histidine kinase inhibitor